MCLMFAKWPLHLFIAVRFLLACIFRELVMLMRYDSGLDICLSSMMSDSCSDVFACSFFLNLSETSPK